MAMFASLVGFSHLVAGFRNRQLAERVGSLLGGPYTTRQATYDLRRLRRNGLIARKSGSQRYELTPLGRKVAVLFVKTQDRILAPGLAMLDLRLPDDAAPSRGVAGSWKTFNLELDRFLEASMLAA
jgi:hypothetical protein